MGIKDGLKWFWDWYAVVYDSIRDLFPYQELLRETVLALRLKESGLAILDAGCGTGNLARTLSCYPVTVHGIDRSPAMVKRAREKPLKRNVAHFLIADLNETLPYHDSTFDHAVSLNVLYAVKNPAFVLGELSRVVKFGSMLVLALPTHNPSVFRIPWEHLRVAWNRGLFRSPAFLLKTLRWLPKLCAVILINLLVIKRTAQQSTIHFFSEEDLANLLWEKGFRVVKSTRLYAGTDIFVVATKVLKMREERGREISIEIAETNEDFRALHRLRYDTYCREVNYLLNPEDYPDEQERDAYDEHSVHMVVRSGGAVVATMRLIKDSPLGFLLEEGFRLPPSVDRSKTLEHSRAAIRREFRGSNLMILLTEAAYRWQRERGYTICIGAAVDRVRVSLEKLRWQFFGEPRMYHNMRATPMIFYLGEDPRGTSQE